MSIGITILCENTVGRENSRVCLAEWGFSVYIRTDKVNILFDTGHTDLYWRNACRMNIDLDKTDFVVFSHHHWDHVEGIQYHKFSRRKKLVLHPLIPSKIEKKISRQIEKEFDLIKTERVLELSENVFFLGEIPSATDFEENSIPDDSAIAVKTAKGAVVISGCSHSGICNICEYAKKITGQELYAVIGGMHLFEKNREAAAGTIEYFKNEKPEHLYPMHCIDLPVLAEFYNAFGIRKYSAGDEIII